MNETQALTTRLDKLEGEVLAYQVLLAGALPSIEWRNNHYRNRLRELQRSTSDTLQSEPAKLAAFTAVSEAIFKELQV